MVFEKNDVEGKLLEDGTNGKIVILRENSKARNNAQVLSVVDILLSIFVVTPLVVFAWRGSWGYMDVHVEYFPYLPCFLIGMMIHILLAMTQDSLHKALVESDKYWSLRLVSHFFRRFYTYVFLTITILHWRGGWGLIDDFMGIQFTENAIAKKEGSHWFLIIWLACFVTLIVIKGLRNAIAPPFAVCIDKREYVFRFPTMFSRKSKNKLHLLILDCSFSVGVMGNLVVAFWRGLWIILDIILLPDDHIWSAWVSLVLGLLMTGLVFRLQSCMKNLCATFSGIAKIAIADFYIILSCISTLLYWRGSWNLLSIYFLPNDVELSCIVSHFIGFMFLVVLGCSNSMLVRGVYKDGKEPNGECVVFPCQYLRIILEQEDPDDSEEISSDHSQAKMNSSDNVDD